jgi:SWI/SNF-related matrix-associated actin-dependent regulator 1 of chromatin subfamily A
VLKRQDYPYLLLTGDTAVDVRQSLVDEFTEDESISVFLLSTKAGGMGINLTAASVVIMYALSTSATPVLETDNFVRRFDQDFNPHNDRQAQDRAYRIGQKVDVDVIKLISRGTIEEDMLRMGETKLALDEAVAGDSEEGGADDSAVAKQGMKSLIGVLRKQIEEEDVPGDKMDVDEKL